MISPTSNNTSPRSPTLLQAPSPTSPHSQKVSRASSPLSGRVSHTGSQIGTDKDTILDFNQAVNLLKEDEVPSKRRSRRFSNLLRKGGGDDLDSLKYEKSKKEEIKKLTSEDIESIMNSKNFILSDHFLQSLNMDEIKKTNREFLIHKFVSDKYWPHLNDWQKSVLPDERKLYEAEVFLHNFSLKELTNMDKSLFLELSTHAYEKLNSISVKQLLNLHWRNLNEDHIELLFNKLPEDLVDQLEPELQIKVLSKKADISPLLDSNLRLAHQRKDIREKIFTNLYDYLHMAWLNPEEQVRFFRFFTDCTSQCIKMKTPFYLEAKTVKTFEFLNVLTCFITLEDFVLQFMPRYELSRAFRPRGEPVHQLEFSQLAPRTFVPSKKPVKRYAIKKEPSCTMASGSLYPIIEYSNRLCDPICDDMVYLKWMEGTFIFAGSTGGGWPITEEAPKLVNRAFINAIKLSFDPKLHLNKADPALLSNLDVFRTLIQAVSIAERNLKSLAERKFEKESSSPSIIEKNPSIYSTLLGIMGQHQEGQSWKVFTVNVGNSKLYHYKAAEGVCTDVIGRESFYPILKNFKGGRLGLDNDSFPDLSNLLLLEIDAQEGDILLPLSQGVYHSLNPQYLQLTPLEVFSELIHIYPELAFQDFNADPSNFKSLFWEDCREHVMLKERYAENCMTQFMKIAYETNLDPVELIVKHCTKITHLKRKWMTENPHKKEPMNEVDSGGDKLVSMGKLNHISVAAIKLGPLLGMPALKPLPEFF